MRPLDSSWLCSLVMAILVLPGVGSAAPATTKAAGSTSTTRPAEICSAVIITSGEGAIQYRSMSADEVRAWQRESADEYARQVKEWQQALAEFRRTHPNSDSQFETPRPKQAAMRVLRANLPREDADKLLADIEAKEIDRKSHTYYRCLLGKFRKKDTDMPFVSLQVPDGRNLLDESVLRQLRGKVDINFSDCQYVGTGRVTVPRDGVYLITTGSGSLKLDDLQIGQWLKDAETELKAGTYKVALSNYGNGISGTGLRIVEKQTKAEVPVYNSLLDIEYFMTIAVGAQLPKDLSGFRADRTTQVLLPR